MSTSEMTRTSMQRRMMMNGADDFNSDKIKRLRKELNMTQENFAHEIGVTFATVNRWENGRTVPNKVAQKILKMMEKKFRKVSQS